MVSTSEACLADNLLLCLKAKCSSVAPPLQCSIYLDVCKETKIIKTVPVFIKLLSRKYTARQIYILIKNSVGHQLQQFKLNVSLDGIPFLLSNICLCLARFCEYMLYEIMPCTLCIK